MTRLPARLAAALAAFCAVPAAFAAENSPAGAQTLVAFAKWQMKADRLTLIIPLGEGLTSKQKDMIDGGFTTVSQLTLRMPGPGGEDEATPQFYGVRCSVKFDAWEETYDVARLDDRPRTALVKTFPDYGDLCLKAEVDRPEIVERFAQKGGVVLARLDVKQTSAEEADKIKDWLIQQQSGVMQGLFSHMLGELTLNQTLRVRVNVPAKPATVERSPPQGDEREPKRKG